MARTLMMMALSLLLLSMCLGCEIYVLLHGTPPSTSDIVLGRILGLMDAVSMLVLSYWFSTTDGSQRKTDIIAASAPPLT